jgi:hypothetical protein
VTRILALGKGRPNRQAVFWNMDILAPFFLAATWFGS